jgi:hypothetical protein
MFVVKRRRQHDRSNVPMFQRTRRFKIVQPNRPFPILNDSRLAERQEAQCQQKTMRSFHSFFFVIGDERGSLVHERLSLFRGHLGLSIHKVNSSAGSAGLTIRYVSARYHSFMRLKLI